MPFKQPIGLATGARVLPVHEKAALTIGPSWLGRMVNGWASRSTASAARRRARARAAAPRVHPLRKQPVREPLDVGVRAINGLLTLGSGQRVGLMAGSGRRQERAARDHHAADRGRRGRSSA
jgi:flagellum-specific ATP synthase